MNPSQDHAKVVVGGEGGCWLVLRGRQARVAQHQFGDVPGGGGGGFVVVVVGVVRLVLGKDEGRLHAEDHARREARTERGLPHSDPDAEKGQREEDGEERLREYYGQRVSNGEECEAPGRF